MLAFALFSMFSAHAEESSRVFVGPFSAQGSSAEVLTAALPEILEEQLRQNEALDVILLSSVGPIHDTPADVYAASCPESEFVGCAYVLAEAATADFALTGTVQSLESGSRVQVHIVDVAAAREALSFQVDLAEGDSAVFAEGVGRVLMAVVRGEVGQEQDLREQGESPVEEGVDQTIVSQELDQLSTEIGGVTTLEGRLDMEIDRPRFSMAELVEEMNTEGSKPWERLEMTPREYLRYKNSGEPLYRWQELLDGRRGHLMLRAHLGFGRAPMDGTYYGRFVRSNDTLEVLETYAWQNVASGSGTNIGAAVGFGVTPEIEIGLLMGVTSGRFASDLHSEVWGQSSIAGDPYESSSQTPYIGPQVLAALLPTSSVRPVVGGHFTVWRGSAAHQHLGLGADFPELDAPTMFLATGLAGVEASLGDELDLWLHVPVSAIVSGVNTPVVYNQGESPTGEGDPTSGWSQPTELPATSAAVLVGIQVRLLGAQRQERGLDDYID